MDLRRRTLADEDGIAVLDVVCESPARGWSTLEHSSGYMLVFPRRGAFVRRVGRCEMLLDPGTAYFEQPEVPQQVAHPQPGGDVCTALVLPAQAIAQLTGSQSHMPTGLVFTDSSVDLAQRTLVARLRAGLCGGFEAAEQVLRLTAQVLEQWCPEQLRRGRPATARARRRLVNAARERLAAEPGSVRLASLASSLGTSPYHLSRIFHAETGQTLARHRTRLRVRLALERIEGGERDLARLAADLGFADHAHLTRTLRRELGQPPAHLRRLFARVA